MKTNPHTKNGDRTIVCVMVLLGLLFLGQSAKGQSRLYLSVGTTSSYGGNYSTLNAKKPNSFSAELEWDKKVMGSLYVVSGLSTYGIGYSATGNLLVPSNSTYSARYLAVPLMARLNANNRNILYIDIGYNLLYLAQAHLSESTDKFYTGNLTTYEGNVGPYMNRFYQSFKIQETFCYNRLSFSLFFIFLFKGQSSINNLADHWGLNPQQSTFLSSRGYSDFNLVGFKISGRIR